MHIVQETMTSDSDAPYLQFYTHLINVDPNAAKRSAMRGYAGNQYYSGLMTSMSKYSC